MPFPSLVRNGGAPRPAMLARTASAWRDKLPSTGRISLEVVFKQKSLHISEIRAMAARTRFDDWKTNEIEECILLAGMNVEISPGHFRMAPVLLAAASGHALARWHQRSLDASPSALIADLRALALAAAISELDAGSEFAVQAGSGRWVGLLTSTSFEDVDRAERIFSARSFLS